MKNNNKGFMMAEVIIVSVMILLVLMSMYTGYSKVIKSYDSRIDYYNVDGVYRLAYIRDELMAEEDITYGNWLNRILKEYNNNIDAYNTDIYNHIGSVGKLIDEKIYITKKSQLDNLASINNIKPSMNDYIQYLKKTITLSNDNSYIMILEWNKLDRAKKKTNNYYYSYLEVEV